MQKIAVQDAQADLPHLLEAAVRAEMVLIVGDDQQTVQLVPVVSAKRPRKAGSAKGLITFADDFDAPLPDFDEYTG